MVNDAMGGGLPAVIALRDGGELRVDAEGVHIGATLYRLEQIQDARQVSPDPETIGLRVDGVGLVTLIPARPGDAAVALEALFRLRPGLRPAGGGPAGAGVPPAGAWPYGPPPGYGYPPPPGGPVGYPGYPPPGYGYPPPYPGYAIVPPMPGQPGGAPGSDPYSGPRRPGVGLWPQGIGDVLGTTFRLYFRNFWRLALLGLGVALLPGLLNGGVSVAVDVAEGLDPTKGILQQSFSTGTMPGSGNLPNSPIFQWIQHPPSPTQIALAVGIGLLLFLLFLVWSAWQTASLAWGAREVVRGQPVRVGRAMRVGLGRLPKVLGATLLLVLIAMALVAVATAPIWLSIVASAGAAASGDTGSAATAALLGVCLGFPIYIALLVGVVYVMVRLGLAPYAAACDGLSPGKAIGWSWSLTSRNWWRTFLPVLVVSVSLAPILIVASGFEFISLIAVNLVAFPLLEALAAPLAAMASVVIYYDLRLRREGFPTLARELELPGFAPGPTGAAGPAAGAAPSGTPNEPSGPATPERPPLG